MQFRGKILKSVEEGWYNISTHRPVKNIKPEHFALRGFPYIGEREDVLTLLQENHLSQELIYQPFDSIDTLVDSVMSRLTLVESSPLNNTRSSHLLTLSQEGLRNLSTFHLTGLFTQARLVDVIDGDTIDIAIQLFLDDLSSCQVKGERCYITFGEGSFITRLRCRLYGLDTKEVSTEEGKECREEMKRKVPSLFWILIVGTDKYGRTLIIPYLDRERKTKILPSKYTTYLGGKKG